MEADGLTTGGADADGRAPDDVLGVGPAAGVGDTVVGLGVDLVDVARLGRALTRTPGLTGRLFTADERAYCVAARGAAAQHARYAARFAAKEAAMKALGVGIGGIGWHDVAVARGDSGAPTLLVGGRAAELADRHGVGSTGRHGHVRWMVSLTHAGGLAQATVLLCAP